MWRLGTETCMNFTSMILVVYEHLFVTVNVGHLVKKFAEFYGTKTFTDAFTRP
jgi:hypothetical protein